MTSNARRVLALRLNSYYHLLLYSHGFNSSPLARIACQSFSVFHFRATFLNSKSMKCELLSSWTSSVSARLWTEDNGEYLGLQLETYGAQQGNETIDIRKATCHFGNFQLPSALRVSVATSTKEQRRVPFLQYSPSFPDAPRPVRTHQAQGADNHIDNLAFPRRLLAFSALGAW